MNKEQVIKKVMNDDITGKMERQYSGAAMFSIHCE